MLAISEQVARHLDYLELEEECIDDKLRAIIKAEYRRRLARYQYLDRIFAKKYGMSFREFEEKNMVKELGYSWEVESDSDEWELALDGMETLERRLSELREDG